MSARTEQKAPDFTMPAYRQGEYTEVSLSDYEGKWLLLFFYPGDFTFVWTTEISVVAEKYSEFQELGVEVVSVSLDSKHVHKMWNDKELSKMVEGGIPFAMATDATGKVGEEYDVFSEARGVELRGTFIIDPDGVVQSGSVLAEPMGRDVDEILRQIRAIQHIRASEGSEVTPVGWIPGKLTLNPGPALVGKVCDTWKA